ncbi:polysaccharide ABC transporter ATP-binding protein [Agromyces seonyuensis]|uniref:ATP-binding cassette domain-containing protein n=1 Tax=Agromyces seonyuensis TaxID=2662446 RepID=A0A6I4NSV3_9MICO|nr:ABC transporter ATP-binding protein [Agromyces seonyuensis]MWB97270.1 ATP-binding cassette domain-containing protein [Agromyces seonyuensis]
MRETAITVEGLSKTYRLNRNSAGVDRITDAVWNRIKHPFARAEYDHFDALSDVDFEVPWGEALGIIGRNGAGKSTLLKLLTRITAPTTGRIDLGGRVGSLLEVGTGFHPELTGRENIFLNGALLGMTRGEIRRRFDEIVDFSGVERFLDTPVKRYSSGMYVRLAFSVAAHLDTEILAIDEVLAVGDAEFQAKSLAKMRDVAKDGRTVLYVSHQMQTVTNLCTSAIYLDRGTLQYQGSVNGALEVYRSSFERYQATQREPDNRAGTGQLRLQDVTLGELTQSPTDDTIVELALPAAPDLIGDYFLSCHINDQNGVVIAQCDSRLLGRWLDPSRPHDVTLRVRNLWLKPGTYSVDVYVCQMGILDAWEGAAAFDVLPSLPYPELTSEDATANGIVLADFDFEVD